MYHYIYLRKKLFFEIFSEIMVFVRKYPPKVLEKGLGFSPTPSSINEADIQRDFDHFFRKMRCKWYFRNESQDIPSEVSPY